MFYSGKGNYERATQYAISTGKKTIEMTEGGKTLLSDPLFQSLSRNQQRQIWVKASTPFAESASGRINAFINGARADRTFRTIEEPILRRSRKVYGYKYWY